jgi:NADPH:quinone reductase-like Zn-dependent oxidoreductase
MKAFAIDELGQPGSIQDLPIPQPEDGQVRVRVNVAGINPFDNGVLQGYAKDYMEHRFPLVPGMDAAGTIDAVGPGAEGWAAGDRVFGSVGKPFLGAGTLAEYVTMSAGTIARTPDALADREVAAIPVAGATAFQIAEDLGLGEGNVVVAVGATGGVGSYFVQLAARVEALVVAVCSTEHAEYARGLGAVHVVDYAAEDVAETVRALYPEGIDAIANLHGDADRLARLAELVGEGGRVASATGGADVDGLAARGITATNVMGAATTQNLDELAALIDSKDLVVPPITEFPLERAAEAFAAIGTGHTQGKIVVTIG